MRYTIIVMYRDSAWDEIECGVLDIVPTIKWAKSTDVIFIRVKKYKKVMYEWEKEGV